MLSTPQPRVVTSFTSAESWFSPSKSGEVFTPVAPKIVTVRVPKHAHPGSMSSQPSSSAIQQHGHARPISHGTSKPKSRLSSTSTSSLSSPPSSRSVSTAECRLPKQTSTKRKSPDDVAEPDIESDATSKKRRVGALPRKGSSEPRPKKRASKAKPRNARRSRTNTNELEFEEHVYRKSRSCSTTASEQGAVPCDRVTWTEEDGAVGDALVTSEDVVKALMPKYKAYFSNPSDPEDKSFEPHATNYPYVDLEYPNDNATERFILLIPKDKDHYNPIMCLEQSLHTIVKHYLTPEQKALFGTLPEDILKACVDSDKPTLPSSSSALPSLTPVPSPPTSTPSPLTSLSASSSDTDREPCCARPTNLLRAFSRAKRLRDGPAFVYVMSEINKLFRAIKTSAGGFNPLRNVPRSWASSGIPQKVINRIIEESYQRSIGPKVDKLKRYSAFSSEVYGELMPALTSDILQLTALRPGSLFLDLGSGVGNVVLQAALQSGCSAFGVELKESPALLAEEQHRQMRLRCRMWGVAMGDVELEMGNMITSARVDELMSKADVVLVNNFVFKEELNAALRPKFLDLKEGAIVVSLKAFAPPSAQRLTERNIDDISAIFDVTSHEYGSGTVSWSSAYGSYYLHRVDREGYRDCRAKYERVQERMGRRRASRR